jgi:PAS domain S-box-containing protein
MENSDEGVCIFQSTQERADYLAKVIWSSPGFMYVKDVHSRYVICNENFAKASGFFQLKDIVGKKDNELAFSDAEVRSFQEDDALVLSGVSHLNVEESQLQSDGNYRTILAKKVPFRDDEGSIIGIYANYFDITEKKNREKELLQSKKNSEKVCQLQAQLIADIRGIVQTPVCAMMGMSEAALHSADPISYREALEGVIASGKKCIQALEDLQKYQNSNQDENADEFSSFYLNDLLESIRVSVKLSAQKKGVELIIENLCQSTQCVHSNPLAMRKIIVNLIEHAILNTYREKIHVIYYLGPPGELGDDAMTFHSVIKDANIDIDKSELGKILNRFSRTSPTYVTSHSGLGSPLYVASLLIQSMRGTLRIEGDQGRASTIHCMIPVQCLAKVQGHPRETQPEVVHFPSSHTQFTQTILVLENTKPIKLAMEMLLKHLGCHVTFKTVQDALVQPVYDFDMIFVDFNGCLDESCEVIVSLRKHYGDHTPIIGLSSHALAKDEKAFMALGLTACIEKPVSLDVLKKIFTQFHCK